MCKPAATEIAAGFILRFTELQDILFLKLDAVSLRINIDFFCTYDIIIFDLPPNNEWDKL